MPFNAAVADVSNFPWAAWREAQTRAARMHRGAISTESDAAGWIQLRKQIAHHLALFRGVRARPEQVLIFSSSQTALVSISMLLLNPGDEAVIEDPGYPGARHAFELAGARLRPLSVDSQGLPLEGLNAASSPKLVYMTPSHQYPTGTSLPLVRRLAWLDAANERGFAIVEDDYDGEFRYDACPIPAMQGLRSGAPVFYLGTFSKILFPGFRLSYAVVPTWAEKPLTNLKSLFEPCVSMLQQASLSCFMESGELETHVRRMHSMYARKRDLLHKGLIELGCGYEPTSALAGLHMSAKLPNALHPRAAREGLRTRANQANLAIGFTSDYALNTETHSQLFLRYGGCSTEQIHKGLQTLGLVTRECMGGRF